MAKTPSTMIPLQTKAPDFSLPDIISDKTVSLSALPQHTATVIMFICNHCPFVTHIIEKLAEVARIYQQKDINFIAINSNNVERYPEDSPINMKKFAEKYQFTFPYLYDESQDIAHLYQAACTPDFYIFDRNLKCVYRGQFDDSRPGSNHLVTGKSLIQALDCLIQGQPLTFEQYPSLGCNIKWKE